jgi:hypothetical protein
MAAPVAAPLAAYEGRFGLYRLYLGAAVALTSFLYGVGIMLSLDPRLTVAAPSTTIVQIPSLPWPRRPQYTASHMHPATDQLQMIVPAPLSLIVVVVSIVEAVAL